VTPSFGSDDDRLTSKEDLCAHLLATHDRLRDNETLSERTFIMTGKHFSVAIAFTIFMLAAFVLAQPMPAASALSQPTSRSSDLRTLAVLRVAVKV
jgi:hypothetical protein